MVNFSIASDPSGDITTNLFSCTSQALLSRDQQLLKNLNVVLVRGVRNTIGHQYSGYVCSYPFKITS